MTDDIKTFVSKIAEHHQVYFDENPGKDFSPMLFVHKSDDEIVPILIRGFSDDDEKDAFVLWARDFLEETEAKSYVFSMEAWRTDEQGARDEIIFTIGVDRQGESKADVRKIVVDTHGAKHLIEETAPENMGGRFANLFETAE